MFSELTYMMISVRHNYSIPPKIIVVIFYFRARLIIRLI